LWRQKQLEYTWLRALMERYEALAGYRSGPAFVVRRLSIDATDGQLERLMDAYLNPAALDEARFALGAVQGSPLAILSNGSLRMLDSAVRHNGLESYFDGIISDRRNQGIWPPGLLVQPIRSKNRRLGGPPILRCSGLTGSLRLLQDD
jgi:HAD superfamily hydrolase (TIGR01493 family)